MPDFVSRLAQRGAGLRSSAAPQPASAPWAAARLGGPADIVMEPEPGMALLPEPPALAAPRRSPLTEGPAPVEAAAVTRPAVVAETPRASAVSVALPSEPSPGPPASQPQDALSAPQAPANTAAALSRVDLAPPPPAAPVAPVARFPDPDIAPVEMPAAPGSRSEAKAGLLPGNRPANPAPQVPRPASAAAPAPARELPAALAATRAVPVLTLPQSVRPAASTMPEAATAEQRPIQVRIGRVEVRAAQPAAAPGPRPAQAGTQGFGAMQLARSWLGRSFY